MRNETDVFKDCLGDGEQTKAMITPSGKVMLFVDERSVILDFDRAAQFARQLLEMCGEE